MSTRFEFTYHLHERQYFCPSCSSGLIEVNFVIESGKIPIINVFCIGIDKTCKYFNNKNIRDNHPFIYPHLIVAAKKACLLKLAEVLSEVDSIIIPMLESYQDKPSD